MIFVHSALNKSLSAIIVFCALWGTAVSLHGQPQSEAAQAILRFRKFHDSAESFINILNSGETWRMAQLLRPDLSSSEAESLFFKSNPGIAAQKQRQEAVKLTDDNQYVMYALDPYSRNIWIMLYGRKGARDEADMALCSLWQYKSEAWHLIGWGWPFRLLQDEVKKIEQPLSPPLN